jgi:peptidoglycan/LPS O-acetylase OafA/YrhL
MTIFGVGLPAGLDNSNYRSDIDGLRAVAVLSVLAFHAFPAVAPGGFVGVDVFFVISGYLITGIIARDIARGRFSIATFYRRRVLRIFPALILVLAAAYGLGWQSLYGEEFKQLSLEIIAGGAFASNLLFWTQAGYFDTASASKPLLHLWSLGVEEQFYLIWPLLLAFCARRSIGAVAAVAVVGALSFGIGLALAGSHPEAAFFLPFGRFWELAVGALLALAGPRNISGRPARILSIGGVALTLSAALLIRESPDFPGWIALWPTLGAAAILAAGPKAIANRGFLSLPPLVAVGRISYPLYLWHWVFLSFAFILAGGTPPWGSRLALLVLSLAAAWATWFLFERWIRNGRRGAAKALALCALMVVVIAVAAITFFRNGFDYRKGSNPLADVRTAAMGAGKGLTEPRCLIAPDEIGDRFFCATDKRGPARVLMWGDSKAEALFWGLMRSSPDDRRWSLVGRWGCPPMQTAEPAKASADERACARVNRAVARALPGHPEIGTVVLTFASHFLNPPAADGAPSPEEEALEATVAMLLGLGKTVVVTLDNPELPDPRLCMDRAALGFAPVRWLLGVDRTMTQVTRCDRPLAAHLAETAAYRAAIARFSVRHPDVLIYDPTPILCDEKKGVCPMVRDGAYLYSYGNHMSDTASDRIAAQLLPLIEQQAQARP